MYWYFFLFSLATINYNDIFHFLESSGRSSVVEHLVANENVESSNLFARSNHLPSFYNISDTMNDVRFAFAI